MEMVKEKIWQKIETIKQIVSEKWFCVLKVENLRNVEFILEMKNKLEKNFQEMATKIIWIFIFNILIIITSSYFIENPLGLLFITFIYWSIIIYITEKQNIFSRNKFLIKIMCLCLFISIILQIDFKIAKIIFISPLFLLFIFIPYLIFSSKRLTLKKTFSNDEILSKMNWLKNKYITVFENNVFIDNKNYKIISWDLLTNPEVFNFLFQNPANKEKILKKMNNESIKIFLKEHEKLVSKISYYNKNERKFTNFYENTVKLENLTKILEKIKNKLEQDIHENKDIFAKSTEIEKWFKYFSEKIEEILNLKNKIIDFLKISFQEKIDFTKYNLWLKNQTVSPIISMKNILQKNIEYCDYLLEKNKNHENEQIQISNKRLEIQKNSLQKQISILDEKINILKE